MTSLNGLSALLYYQVNQIIGYKEIVSCRRDSFVINDIVTNYIQNSVKWISSGSKCEGFDMAGSDFDNMVWMPNIHVICDLSQKKHYNISTETVLLAESNCTRPGFVLLRFFSQNFSSYTLALLSVSVSLHNGIYISSSMYRQFCHQLLGDVIWNTTIHGPCSSCALGNSEYDVASCFQCLHWPPHAFSWIERCRNKCWPSQEVLRNIVKSGCHFVAIGGRQSSFENVEWRLSFSQAEQKLIFSFNHCQFLVYGLLKIFLKEVLNFGIPDDQRLLCSYFMKTALFWSIQENVSFVWSLENFISGFWNCLKLMIKWVYCQYCPNFFVPENNMFYPKINAINHEYLLSKMLELYNEGAMCLFRCQSIYGMFSTTLLPPSSPFHTCNNLVLNCPEFDYDFTLYRSLYNKSFYQSHAEKIRNSIQFFFKTFRSCTTRAQRVHVYKQIITLFQNMALFRQRESREENNNKKVYKIKKQGISLLYCTTTYGCVTDILYLAMYYYIDGRYIHALRLLEEARHKLYKPYVMFVWVNKAAYVNVMYGKSFHTKTKEAMAEVLSIPVYTNLPELRLELRVRESFAEHLLPLVVSPFVFVHFLSFLCNHHLDNPCKTESLNDLQTLINYGEESYIPLMARDTAWELLGICHQISQQPQDALICYNNALEAAPSNMIQRATLIRIQSINREQTLSNVIEPPLD